MASRKPLTQSAGLLEQLQAVDTLTVGDYDLPNTISDDGKVLITANSAATWDYVSHTDLADLTVDDHHDQSHTHNGTDDSGTVNHADLTGITVDDHHDQSHTHNGTDDSGVVEHDDTANGTIANHDTDATGTELDTLTDGSNADALHTHSGSSLITTPQSYYVSLTGNDSTGNGSTGSRWATIQHALDYVYDQTWGAGSSATINIEEGTYEIAETVVQNKHCPLITIRGEDDAQAVEVSAITSVSSVGSGVYSVTLTVDSTTGLSVGQYYVLLGALLGSRSGLTGAWEITNIADSTTLTIEILTRTLVPGTAPSITIAGWVPKVVLTSTDAAVFTVKSSFVTFSNMSVASTDNVDGFIFNGVDNVGLGPYVTVTGCSQYGIFATLGASLSASHTCVSRCDVGFRLQSGSPSFGENCCFSACDRNIQLSQGKVELLDSSISAGITYGVDISQGAAIRLADACVLRDCLTGIRAFYLSLAYTSGIITGSNGTNSSPAHNVSGNANSWVRLG